MTRKLQVLAALALVLTALPFATPAEAQTARINGAKVVGECIHEYDLYENDNTHKAFAASSNGQFCGYSYGYDSLGEAEDRALEECGTRSRNCRIIASY